MLQGIREFYFHGYLYKNYFWGLILWSTSWASILVVLILKEDEIAQFINELKFKTNLTIFALILLIGIFLRIILFDLPGYSSYDAWNYVVTGHYINDGWIPYKDPDIHPHFLTQYAPFFYLLLDIIINPNFELIDWRVLINLLDIFTAILLSLIPQDRFSKLFVSIAYLFNPLIIFETAWNGHNDLLVVLFLILGMILIKGTELQNFKTIRSFNLFLKTKKLKCSFFL